jgi:hypothetical protein
MSDRQAVIVTDLYSEVMLTLSACGFPAAMSPDEARFVAKELIASAHRVEQAMQDVAKEKQP